MDSLVTANGDYEEKSYDSYQTGPEPLPPCRISKRCVTAKGSSESTVHPLQVKRRGKCDQQMCESNTQPRNNVNLMMNGSVVFNNFGFVVI